MSSISLGLAGVSFEYNGRGERVRKVHEEFGVIKTTNYLFDEAGHLLVEQFVDGATTTTSEIIWMDGQPVGVIRNNVLRYIEPDHLGTPRQVIDRTRDVAVWRWDLLNDPFGESAPNTNPDADGTYFVFNMRFPGQIHDAESGLNYNYFRDYEPGTGRYVESDPIGLAGGISTYGYVRANPLKLIDPQGMKVQVCCRKAEILFGWFRHCWIKTDTITAGMASSPQCRANVGDDYEPPFITPTYVSDHSCETPDTCTDLPPHFNVDEDCVNRELNIGKPLGGFDPFVNNCQQFTARVIKRCSKPGWPSPTPTPPPPAPAPGGGGGCCK